MVHGVHVGSGRVGKQKELEIAKDEAAATRKVADFLDALLASFDDLRLVLDGDIEPLELRDESLLGSATMIRVLAIVWHDLREGDKAAGIKPMPAREVEAFFKQLEPHMRVFEDVLVVDERGQPVLNQKTGEQEFKHGIPLGEPLWMPTDAFIPGTKAPQARAGSIRSLADAMIRWARKGNTEL